jgi:hypothetical protein
MQRRPVQQAVPFELRLEEHAKRLRQEAASTPSGVEREEIIRKARQAETASHIHQWVSSKGLRPPS